MYFNIEINNPDQYTVECEKVHVLVFINYCSLDNFYMTSVTFEGHLGLHLNSISLRSPRIRATRILSLFNPYPANVENMVSS